MKKTYLRYKKKIALLVNYYIDKKLPFKRYRQFYIDRNRYKNNLDRYKNYTLVDKFLNLGAGNIFYHPRWDCFDLYTNGLNLVLRNYTFWDFNQNLSFPDKYKLIYCSHVLEHIPRKSIKSFLTNVYESMTNDSIFRIVIPDADLAYKAYKENRYNFFEAYDSKVSPNIDKEYLMEFQLLLFIATEKANKLEPSYALDIREKFKDLSKADFLDYLISNIERNNSLTGHFHVNWFNFLKIKMLLNDVGFSVVNRSNFGQSESPAMRDIPLFDSTLPSMSLYIEAKK